MTSKRALPLTVFLAACSASLLAGCAGSDSGAAATGTTQTEADEVDSTRASRELVVATTQRASAVAPTPSVAAPVRPLFSAHAIEATEGGDGRGETVLAPRPVAFDLDARRFPPRALDPVLHVGEQRFVHYLHPAPGVLRFVAADAASLTAGVRVFVQYGDDAASRTVVTEALELP